MSTLARLFSWAALPWFRLSGLAWLPTFSLLAVALAACAAQPGVNVGESAALPAEGRERALKVVTSITVLADFVRQVGGEGVSVRSLLPPAVDVHTYEPTPGDLRAVAEADVVFLNGLGLDDFVEQTVKKAGKAGLPVVRLAETAPLRGAASEAGGTAANPHLWLDVGKAKGYVEEVRDELARLNPAGRPSYEARAAAYLGELDQLDAWIKEEVKRIPAERRKLVTTHDAFPHFARAYGFTVAGFVTESSGREPSAQKMAALVALLRREGISAVFAEPQLRDPVLEQAAREAGVSVSKLYSDALDEQVPTYVELMRFDTRQLVAALGR